MKSTDEESDDFTQFKPNFNIKPPQAYKQKFDSVFKQTPKLLSDYFDRSEDIKIGKNTFKIHRKGSVGPIILFLHGATYSSLTWALLIEQLSKITDYQCIFYDLRCHGNSLMIDEKEFSIETFKKDTLQIINYLFPEINTDTFPGLFIVGHSLGGCIAVHIANEIPKIVKGIVVIDALEGMCISSLVNFSTFISNRPNRFINVKEGIKYMYNSEKTSRNLKSAIISCLDQFIPIDFDNSIYHISSDYLANNPDSVPITWKTNISQAKNEWNSWFYNLNNLFLGCSVSKCLIVVGRERLDNELVIAEMQGRFQINYFPNCSHFIHEDEPLKVANVISVFVQRNLKLPFL